MLEATGVLSTLDDGPAQWLSDEHRKAVANNAKETSELIGFWVTWHLAGGFDRLELWGWHRATIYRKIKRFRERFGAHPDDYAFDWIDLDLPKTWSDRLRTRTVKTAAMTTLTEVASGVDSLYLSGRSVLEPELLDELEAGRVDAQQTGSPTQIWFGGYAWDLQPRSLNRYRFRLDHPLVTLGITPSQNLPTLYAQCRSEGIHSLGAQGVVNWLHGVLDNVGIARACTVSRIDVHADWQGWTLTGDERSRFVCRAKDLTTYENDLELTGFSFCRRSSNPPLAGWCVQVIHRRAFT